MQLALTGKTTPAKMMEEFEPQAVKRIKTRLVLEAIVKAENIEVSDERLDEEIQKMQDDAKAHEAEDQKRKEAITAKNNAEALIYQAEKTVKDLGDKADPAKVKEINDAVAKLKETLKGDDTEKIKADADALTKPLHELTENLYKQAQQAQQQAAGQQGAQQQSAGKQDKDNVVDADYKVVDDDDKK